MAVVNEEVLIEAKINLVGLNESVRAVKKATDTMLSGFDRVTAGVNRLNIAIVTTKVSVTALGTEMRKMSKNNLDKISREFRDISSSARNAATSTKRFNKEASDRTAARNIKKNTENYKDMNIQIREAIKSVRALNREMAKAKKTEFDFNQRDTQSSTGGASGGSRMSSAGVASGAASAASISALTSSISGAIAGAMASVVGKLKLPDFSKEQLKLPDFSKEQLLLPDFRKEELLLPDFSKISTAQFEALVNQLTGITREFVGNVSDLNEMVKDFGASVQTENDAMETIVSGVKTQLGRFNSALENTVQSMAGVEREAIEAEVSPITRQTSEQSGPARSGAYGPGYQGPTQQDLQIIKQVRAEIDAIMYDYERMGNIKLGDEDGLKEQAAIIRKTRKDIKELKAETDKLQASRAKSQAMGDIKFMEDDTLANLKLINAELERMRNLQSSRMTPNIDLSKWQSLKNIVGDTIPKAMDGLETVFTKVGRAGIGLKNILVDTFKSLAGVVQGLISNLVTLAKVIGTAFIASAGYAIKTAEDWQQVNVRMQLVTNTYEEFIYQQKELYKISLKTHVAYETTTDLYAKMSLATQGMGVSQTKMLRATELVNKAMAISGSVGQSGAAAIVQFTQALSGNFKGSGQEIRSIIEQAPGLFNLIIDGMEMSRAEFRRLAKEGKISTKEVIDGINKIGGVYDKKFEKILYTTGMAWTDIKTKMGGILDEMNKTINATEILAKWMWKLANITLGTGDIKEYRKVMIDIAAGMDMAGDQVALFMARAGTMTAKVILWFASIPVQIKGIINEIKFWGESIAYFFGQLANQITLFFLKSKQIIYGYLLDIANMLGGDLADALGFKINETDMASIGIAIDKVKKDINSVKPMRVYDLNTAKATAKTLKEINKQVVSDSDLTQRQLEKNEQARKDMLAFRIELESKKKDYDSFNIFKSGAEANENQKNLAIINTQLEASEYNLERNSEEAVTLKSKLSDLKDTKVDVEVKIDTTNLKVEDYEIKAKIKPDVTLFGQSMQDTVDFYSPIIVELEAKTGGGFDSYVEKWNKISEDVAQKNKDAFNEDMNTKVFNDMAKDLKKAAGAAKELAKRLMDIWLLEQKIANLEIKKALMKKGKFNAKAEAAFIRKNLVDEAKAAKAAYANTLNQIGASQRGTEAYLEMLQAKEKMLNTDIDVMQFDKDAAQEVLDGWNEIAESISDSFANVFESWLDGDLQGAFADLFGDMTKEVINWAVKAVLANETVATALGINAVLTQAQGEPYSAWARMAAMVATVAALGIAVAFGGGGGGSEISEAEMTAAQGNQFSENESVNESLEVLAANQDIGLVHSASMMNSLDALVVAAGAAATSVGDRLSGNNYVSKDGSGIWGGTQKELVSSGIKIDSASIKELTDGTLKGYEYQTEKVTKESWFGLKKKESLSTSVTGDIDTSFADAYTDALIHGFEAVNEAAITLGMTTQEIDAFTKDYETTVKNLNFEGMDAEERQELIVSALGEDMDAYAASFVPLLGYVDQFALAGEEVSTTIIRLANDYEVASQMFDKLGIELASVADGGLAVTESLVQAAGGAEAFSQTWNQYFEDFYSEAEQTAAKSRALEASFAAIGETVPLTVEGYRALVDAQIAELTAISAKIDAEILAAEGAWEYAKSLYAVGTAEYEAAQIVYEASKERIDSLKKDRDEIAESTQTIIENSGAWKELNETMANSYEDMKQFWDIFGTDAEKAAFAADHLEMVFAAVGLSIPVSKAAFKALYLETVAKIEKLKSDIKIQKAKNKLYKDDLLAVRARIEAHYLLTKAELELVGGIIAGATTMVEALAAIDAVIDGIDLNLDGMLAELGELEGQLGMMDSNMSLIGDFYGAIDDAGSACEDAANEAERLARAVQDLEAQWMGQLAGAEYLLEITKKQTGLAQLTFDNFLSSLQNANITDQDQLDDWAAMSSALQALEAAVIENTRANEGGQYVVDIRQAWGVEGQDQAMVDAVAKETGLIGLTIDNFLEEFNEAVAGGLTIEEFNDWQAMSDVLLPIMEQQLQTQLDAATQERDFYVEILQLIEDAYLGGLSYLNSLEKAQYAADLAQENLEDGDTQGYFDALGKQLEYEKKMSVTREEYAIKFDDYIDALQDREYVETPEERSADSLENIEKQILELQDAIEKSSYQP